MPKAKALRRSGEEVEMCMLVSIIVFMKGPLGEGTGRMVDMQYDHCMTNKSRKPHEQWLVGFFELK